MARLPNPDLKCSPAGTRLKKFALLEWHTRGRFYKLLGFVEAENAPHAQLQAWEPYPKQSREGRVIARHAWCGPQCPNFYTNAPKYR